MATNRPALGCLLALACCACSAESSSPTQPASLPGAVQPGPHAATILLSSSTFPGGAGEPLTSLTMLRGSTRTVGALAFGGGGSYLGGSNERVVWATSDTAVVTIRPTGGWGAEIMAAGPGVARLVAHLNGLSAEASITVIEGQEGGGTLVVESFSIIEELSGSGGYYAPRIRLKETSGRGSGRVSEVRFTIPGVAIVTCAGQAEFGPGESRDLLGAIYGMYPFEIGSSRAAKGPPSAVISMFASGSPQQITVNGSYAAMEWPSYALSGSTPGPMTCGAAWLAA